MAKDKRPLPTGEHLSKQYRQMRPLLKVVGLFSTKLASQFAEVEAQFRDVEQMVSERARFAKRFGPLGWTNYDRLSVDLVRLTVAADDDDIAEQGLVEYHLDADQLAFLSYRFHISRFDTWCEIYERAVERAAAEDYLSSVPLILIIIDGICTTKTGKHPFSGGADAPVFDSETSGAGGIAEGLAILGATRRKLDIAPIDSPYRHGILHGLNPSFGNAKVAAKAFNLLQASVDYFDRREDEEVRIAKAEAEQRPASWTDLARTMANTEAIKRQIGSWRARPTQTDLLIASSDAPNSLDPESPEATAVKYLTAITARNFGAVAKATIDHPKRSIPYRAGRHRDELGDLAVTAWQVTGVEDQASAVSVVTIRLEGILNERQWSGEQTMRLIYGDASYDALPRGSVGGQWSVMPNFLPGLWGVATKLLTEGDNAPPRELDA